MHVRVAKNIPLYNIFSVSSILFFPNIHGPPIQLSSYTASSSSAPNQITSISSPNAASFIYPSNNNTNSQLEFYPFDPKRSYAKSSTEYTWVNPDSSTSSTHSSTAAHIDLLHRVG